MCTYLVCCSSNLKQAQTMYVRLKERMLFYYVIHSGEIEKQSMCLLGFILVCICFKIKIVCDGCCCCCCFFYQPQVNYMNISKNSSCSSNNNTYRNNLISNLIVMLDFIFFLSLQSTFAMKFWVIGFDIIFLFVNKIKKSSWRICRKNEEKRTNHHFHHVAFILAENL